MTENKITTNITDIAWNEGYGAYIDYVCKTILESVGGRLNSESMDKLSSEQHTLLAYKWLRDEVMEGGFIQLIYNGYAPYVLDRTVDVHIARIRSKLGKYKGYLTNRSGYGYIFKAAE